MDILQLLIDEAVNKHPERADPLHITYSLLAINQSSIYSTAFALTNCILDLFSSPRQGEFVRYMREECQRVMARHGGKLSDSGALQELASLDSCIKESLRMTGFNTVAVMRKVCCA